MVDELVLTMPSKSFVDEPTPWDEGGDDLSVDTYASFFSVMTSFQESREDNPEDDGRDRECFDDQLIRKHMKNSKRDEKEFKLKMKVVVHARKLQDELRTQKALNNKLAAENAQLVQKYKGLEDAVKMQSQELAKLLEKIHLIESSTG